jgi:hypothetical protein
MIPHQLIGPKSNQQNPSQQHATDKSRRANILFANRARISTHALPDGTTLTAHLLALLVENWGKRTRSCMSSRIQIWSME